MGLLTTPAIDEWLGGLKAIYSHGAEPGAQEHRQWGQLSQGTSSNTHRSLTYKGGSCSDEVS